MVTFPPENAPALKFTVSWPWEYSAHGQQLRKSIPVGIHLNLIRDQEPTNHSARFDERKSRYVTMVYVPENVIQ